AAIIHAVGVVASIPLFLVGGAVAGFTLWATTTGGISYAFAGAWAGGAVGLALMGLGAAIYLGVSGATAVGASAAAWWVLQSSAERRVPLLKLVAASIAAVGGPVLAGHAGTILLMAAGTLVAALLAGAGHAISASTGFTPAVATDESLA